STTPSASLVDLCRALVADVRGKPGKDREKTREQDLAQPRFAPLVAAITPKPKIMPYCVRLIETPGAGGAVPPGVPPAPGTSPSTSSPPSLRLGPGKPH